MIHVCFGLHDGNGHYSKFVGTAMLSLFENHTPRRLSSPSITVHILHDATLTADNRDKLIYLAGRYNQLVNFYNVEELCAEQIEMFRKAFPKIDKSRFTIAAFYRFLHAYVLPAEIKKVICLDADIVVNLDINELWQFELNDNVLAVVPNSFNHGNLSTDPLCLDGLVKGDDYFNSGIMIINLKLMLAEKENIMNAIKFISENARYNTAMDQSVLNYCFSARTLKLPMKFNRMTKWARHFKITQVERMIYHLSHNDSARGLGTDTTDPYNRLWWSYFIRTPFFDAEAIGRLCDGFRKLRNDLMDDRLQFYNMMLGKTRAFFVEPKKISAIQKIFSIRDDELIIPAENEKSLQKLLAEMKAAKGKCVFFIMTEKFLKKKFPFDLLKKEGFVHRKDFVKGWEYVSETSGGVFNTNPLIRAM